MKLSDISKSSVSSLKKEEVAPEDLKNIKKLNKSLFIDFIAFTVFSILGLLLFYSFLEEYFSEGSFIINPTSIFVVISIISLFIFLIYSIIQVKNKLKLSYKKAQYGIVQNKYTLSSTDDRNYFVTVKFPNTNTSISSVRCLYTTYTRLEKNSKVLVISFDGKIAYAVVTNINNSNL